MVDVNNFKQVNTKFGHLTGDTALAEFAALLKASIRGPDAVVRCGSLWRRRVSHFAGGYHNHRVKKVVDRINKHLAEWNIAGHLDGFQLRASIRVAEWHDGESLDEVLDVADQKMYENKTLQCGPHAIHISDDKD
jgi:diguanylate cyclase